MYPYRVRGYNYGLEKEFNMNNAKEILIHRVAGWGGDTKKINKLNSTMKLKTVLKPQSPALNNQLMYTDSYMLTLFSSTSEKLQNVLPAFCFISLFSVHWLKVPICFNFCLLENIY